ncbi:hypothetical protein B5X24_HaOG209139 [Helicoverpa armigera]|nr:hypothetical protein B5X24_HaOG209139 [Helicoverpa armigera]
MFIKNQTLGSRLKIQYFPQLIYVILIYLYKFRKLISLISVQQYAGLCDVGKRLAARSVTMEFLHRYIPPSTGNFRKQCKQEV